MRAMVLAEPQTPLQQIEVATPVPQAGEILLRVEACGVCRTDLHIVDGELSDPSLPIIPRHEIVGRVAMLGDGVSGVTLGQRMGVPWLGQTCGICEYCASGQENLCDAPRFTGYQINGGYAEYTVASAGFCFPLPETAPAADLAPLLCAGLIGYRALRMTGAARRLGIYGFGAAAHILAQVLSHQGREFYAFTRPGDFDSQSFARRLGAAWAGDCDQQMPQRLDACIIFAPAGGLVPMALRQVRKGGTVVCAGIHMTDIPAFPYEILWGERVLRSVANLTREDGYALLDLIKQIPIRTHVRTYPLEQANEALLALRAGEVKGAAVLVMQ